MALPLNSAGKYSKESGSYAVDEAEMSGPVIFVAGRLRKNERTREALAEQLRFTFSYAEKTEKGTWTGYTEYTHDEFKAKYGDILNFAGIDLRKVKDVKKEVDGVMYG